MSPKSGHREEKIQLYDRQKCEGITVMFLRKPHHQVTVVYLQMRTTPRHNTIPGLAMPIPTHLQCDTHHMQSCTLEAGLAQLLGVTYQQSSILSQSNDQVLFQQQQITAMLCRLSQTPAGLRCHQLQQSVTSL